MRDGAEITPERRSTATTGARRMARPINRLGIDANGVSVIAVQM